MLLHKRKNNGFKTVIFALGFSHKGNALLRKRREVYQKVVDDEIIRISLAQD
jgi:hypothetical protein